MEAWFPGSRFAGVASLTDAGTVRWGKWWETGLIDWRDLGLEKPGRHIDLEKDVCQTFSFILGGRISHRNDSGRASCLVWACFNGLSFPDENMQKLLHIRYCLPKIGTPREITCEVEEKIDQKTKILELFLNFILAAVPYFTFVFWMIALVFCFFLCLGKEELILDSKQKLGEKSELGNTWYIVVMLLKFYPWIICNAAIFHGFLVPSL